MQRGNLQFTRANRSYILQKINHYFDNTPDTIPPGCVTEALESACEELRDTDQPEVIREIVAQRIILAAKVGERGPVRVREAALRARDPR
jgi:Cdc6-like AAA superfamily ATPase